MDEAGYDVSVAAVDASLRGEVNFSDISARTAITIGDMLIKGAKAPYNQT